MITIVQTLRSLYILLRVAILSAPPSSRVPLLAFASAKVRKLFESYNTRPTRQL